MTNRSVLLVAPMFPPLATVAVNRIYRLAKCLPQFGWRVHVITVDHLYVGQQDPSLLESLPTEVDITKVRHIEPTLRGVRKVLGFGPEGQGQTNVANAQTHPGAVPGGRGDISLLRNSYNAIRRELWQLPDRYWTWHRPALVKARELVVEHKIPIVVTTNPPWTGHRIGAELQSIGLTWVADFRDPPTYMHHLHGDRVDVFARQRRIEAEAAHGADAVTVASEGIGMILRDMHGPGSMRHWMEIPLGVDEQLFESRDMSLVPAFPYLIFPGRISAEYGDEFFDIFARALESPEVRATGVRLLIVGDLVSNRPVAGPLIERFGLQDQVELWDHLPQRQLLGLLDGALAGVLLDGSTARWWCIHAKAVEYMGIGKPVIARVPRVSIVRMHLEDTGLGVYLDGDGEEAADTLRSFITGDAPPVTPNRAATQRFTAAGQAEAFSRLFDSLLWT